MKKERKVFKRASQALLTSIASIFIFSNIAVAQVEARSGWELEWRPMIQRTHMGDETSDTSSIDWMMGKSGDAAKTSGKVNWARIGINTYGPISQNLDYFGMLRGGTFDLKLDPTIEEERGVDYLLGGGISWPYRIGNMILRTNWGVRAQQWFFNDDDVPQHGTLGMTFGVQPTWGNFSLLVEGTLAAIPLFVHEKWGEHRDTSQLRMKADYTFNRYKIGMEFFHTKTEWTDSEVVQGEDAAVMDDIQLSLIMALVFD
jgi:hypothetical protein